MSAVERAHEGGTSAWLGREYLKAVAGRRLFISSEDRDAVVALMEEKFASALAERVAEGTAVAAGASAHGMEDGRRGRFPTARRCLGGRELLALGEAYWYTEDAIFVRAFLDELAAWSAGARGENSSPWERTSRLLGWCLGSQCMISSPFLMDEDVARLLHGLGEEGRHLDSWLEAHPRAGRDRAAALAGLAILGTCFPESFEEDGWRERGLGELAWLAPRYFTGNSGQGLAPCEAMQVYMPLVVLSIRNDLEVPGVVVAGIEDALRELGHTRTHAAQPPDCASLLPMLPGGAELLHPLRLAGALVLGRLEHEPHLHAEDAGLPFLLGPEFLDVEERPERRPGAGESGAGEQEHRGFLDTYGPSA